MKKLLLTLLLLPFVSLSQMTTITPDTVCYQTPGSIYQVTNTPGATYNWVVTAPGVLQSGQGTNQINVDWSASPPGLITSGISVTSTIAGCPSLPVNLNVLIYQVVPVITAIGPFCASAPCVNLVGTPAGGVFSGTGVVANQFCPTTSGAGIYTITYTYTSNGCVFVATTSVTVNAIPVLTPIEHN